jgi:hypothetical protein
VDGATAIAATVAFVTVSLTFCETDPTVAVIVVVPGLAPVACPLVEEIVATPVSDEAQVTCPASGR